MGIKIKGEKREFFGKNVSRQMRKEGKLPAILYGANTPSIPLAVPKKDIINILKSETGENTIFKVSFNSENRDVMIKEWQKNPVTDELLHVDLIQIVMDKIIRVSVPAVPIGEAVGVRSEGGFVDFVNRDVEIECLPKDIPENIEVDISSLHVHQSLKVGDIKPPEGVEIVSDEDTVLVLIAVPHKEEVVEEEKEEVIAEEEEPEVIKKEKEEAEEMEEKKKEEAKQKEGEEEKE
ncbi:MAG: 50S ribosomal protein L25 [Candidatus Aminicenantaceae bacterium]